MRDQILNLVSKRGDLPPLPDFLINLDNRINDPDSDIENIAKLIETEPVLSGRLLKMANSVLFGGGRDEAREIPDAVMRLGLKMVLDLAYTLQMPGLFKKTKGFNQLEFWKHSLAVGCLARALGPHLVRERDQLLYCYLSGLMHDLGILVFDFLIPDEYSRFLKSAKGSNEPLEVLEERTFGIAHPELGGEFIKKWWPLPPPVIAAVQEHHHLGGLSRPMDNAQIVGMANRIANTNRMTNGTPVQSEPLSPDEMEILDFTSEELEIMVEATQEGLQTTESLLIG
ncbi:MAG: hypothetical protein COV67_14675 [Nitrospinae bacterium CG11_big_fil_rev_8_21_14_0_20_56_8]|nr:MAG: hypothetical protein COV67_14675 [Nitrospinae bacterium CG11_big_fil_rev_8_21_14_0_20_56_8]